MSRDERFKAKDKKTHKITKDGLVEINLSTGEESRLSQRGQDFQLTQKSQEMLEGGRLTHDSASNAQGQLEQESPQDFKTADAPRFSEHPAHEIQPNRQHGTKYQQQFQSEQPEESVFPSDVRSSDVSDKTQEQPRRIRFGKSGDTKTKSTKPNQRGTKYAQNFSEEAASSATDKAPAANTSSRLSSEKQSSGVADKASGSSDLAKPRLQFGKDEVSLDKKLEKSRLKAEKSTEKLADAKKKLPTRHRAKISKDIDTKTGKTKHKLSFEKEVKSQHTHIKGARPLRPVKLGANTAIGYAHKKVFQVEQENVGVEAAHKGELMVEAAARRAYRLHKTAPYRKVAKLEQLNRKRTVDNIYRQALHDNPKLKSNMASRFMQKQKIKRQYAKAAREAKRGAKHAKKAGEITTKIAHTVGGFIRRHPVAVGVVLLLLLLIFIIMTMFGAFSNVATGMLSSVVSSSYVAEDSDIDDAELAYSEWETDLLLEIQNAEATHSGFDEYRYNIGDISHDPYELMGYLTAKYQDFTYAEIQAELRVIFGEQYQLSFVEEVEIHTRTVTKYRSVYDDEGNYEGEESYEEEEEYEWYVLNVNLASRSFSEIVLQRLDSDQREIFDILMQTKGNRQYALNPFNFNWLPSVSSYYGWRVHPGRMAEQDTEYPTRPISGEKDNHLGIDIVAPLGTEILATHDGRVTFAGNSGGYGLVVVIEDDTGLVTKYAHCSELLVSAGQEVEKGLPIAKVGSVHRQEGRTPVGRLSQSESAEHGNSTGPHLHFEVIQNGRHLNPLFFSETGDDGSGRIPPGSPGGVEYPEYPGEPLGDGSYAALITEAEKHLGKPYVFGSNGPGSFDCSSFVCWTFTYSGVYNMPRTTAYGIYQQCTPVSPENARPGDLIFFAGTYSTTSPTSHIGIYVGNGMMIHAGNPIQYTSINTPYWQEHFYAFGRIN